MSLPVFLRKFSVFSLRFLTLAVLIASTVAAVSAAPVEKAVEQPLAPRPLQTAVPAVTLGVPAAAPVGSDVSFTVSFKNNDTQTGYGPFVDLVLDTTGPDGIYPGAPAPANTYDGLGGSLISASYLGVPFVLNSTMWVLEFDAAGHANHPLARDASGAPIVVTAPAGFVQGDKLVVFRLPFGSFVNSQPAAVIDVKVNMSPLADIGVDLNVAARGGFQFGTTALDDWCCDPVANTLSGWNTGAVKPTLFTLTKTYSGPEDEAAAGPNFRTFYPMRYTISAEIAAGQTMTNLVLTDVIPANLQAVTLIASSPAGASCSPVPGAPGGTLACDWGASAVSGTASFTFDFYIPTGVVPPATGDDVSSCNNASASAFWATPDSRDADQTVLAPNPDTGACEHTLTDKSIAVQKSVIVVGGGDPAPGKFLEYTLNFQVADDFVFNNVIVSDIISDGQHYDASFAPTLSVTEHGAFSSGAFNPANVAVDISQIGNDTLPATNGSSTISFGVSDELVSRALDGNLLGGCIPAGGTPVVDCSAYNTGATFGTIVFRTVIQENFTDTYPSGDPSVDQGDILDDIGSITGDTLDTSTLTATGNSEADGTAASVSIGYGVIAKSVYAVTDSNTGVTTLSPSSVQVGAGDLVTYKIEYSLPTSDFEGLTLTDYLPLPIFNATEITTFTNAVCNDLAAGVPAAGKACLGTGDTYNGLSGAVSPALATDAAGNTVKWTYGNYDSAYNAPSKIELVFTVTVRDDPFADGLYLTNQANATETSTQSNSSNGDSIVQIQLTEPVLVGTKGIVASSNPAAVYAPASPAPLLFTAPGSLGARWSGIISSTALAATPINSNLSNVDAGDLVTFAIVIENTGSGINGAFDITLTDTFDALGFDYPTTGDPNSMNLRIAYGDSSSAFSPIGYTRPDDSAATPADLFGGGIKLVDPAGEGVCQAHDPNNGNNVIIITYDLRTKSGIQPGTYINTAEITNYSGTEGGPNFASGLTDTAEITTAQPQLAKTLISTSVVNSVNANNQVVIGEQATYTVTLTVPEGQLPGAILVDTMDSGLAFVALDSLVVSNPDSDGAILGDDGLYSSVMSFDGLGNCTNCTAGTTAGSNNPLVAAYLGQDARQVTFDFGDLTNTNTDNATSETITITYRVVALNTTGNNAGTYRNNSAVLGWTGGSPVTASAPNVRILEPVLTVTKAVAPSPVDAGNTVTFTVTVTSPAGTGTNRTTAYDATWTDTVPAGLTYTPGTLTRGDCSVAALFTLSDVGAPALTGSGAQFEPGQSCIITFDATVDYSAVPGSTITNTASTQWTSLPGTVTDVSPFNTDSDERTGTGTPVQNDYVAAGSAGVQINAVAPTKYLLSTSEAHTSGSDLTIGEIVRYRLVVQLPEGSSPNFQIVDRLPLGLTFLNDNSAKAAFVSNGAGIASADFGTLPIPAVSDSNCALTGATADGTVPVIPVLCSSLAGANIGSDSSSITDTDSYISGSDVYFKLGSLTNSDSDADAEFVVLEFNALVDNSLLGSNDAGDAHSNDFIVTINGAQNGLPSNAIATQVVEPLLSLTKSLNAPLPQDASDPVSYDLLISAAPGVSDTTAFDLDLTDTFDVNLTGLSISSVTTTQGAACAGGTAFSHNGGVFTGNDLHFTASCLDPGETITVTVTGTVAATAPAGYTIPNTADLAWTSLPDAGTISNPTGSTTPGGSGADDGERDNSGGQDDYAASDTADVSLASIVPVKSILATSEASTAETDPRPLAIGEVLRYRLAVTIPEGTNPALTLSDQLALGVIEPIFDATTEISGVGFGTGFSSATYGAGLESAATSTVDLHDGTAFVFPGLVNYNSATGLLTFNLGDIVNNDSDADAETLYIDFNVVVLNSAGNNLGDVFANDFSASETGLGPITSNAVSATLVEPSLTAVKTLDDPTWVYGQTINYTITVSASAAANTSTAYDLVMTDTVPTGLSYLGATLTPAGCTLDDSTAPLLTWTCASLDPGASLVFTFQAQVLAPPAVGAIVTGQNVTNTVDLTWTSLPGAGTIGNATGSDTPGTSGASDGERDGSGGVNDYLNSGTVNGGLEAYYALGNRVWYDTDNSATLNGTEQGVPGVKVWLYASDGTTRILEPDGVTPREATTNANGYYLFDYLPAGDYIVALSAANFAASAPLNGYWSSQTVRNADGSISETAAPGPNNDLDSDVDENGTLTAGEVRAGLVSLGADAEPTLEADTSGTQGDQPDNRANMTVDFGFYKVNIGDLVYEDVNANGTYDAGTDTPLDGVTVELLASDGTPITSVPTSGGGLYAFADLPTGDYRVRVTTPTDMLSTIDSADAADSADPDTHTDNNDNGIGIGAATATSVTSGLLTMAGADFGAADAGYPTGITTDTSLDFGFVYAYALGNRVWFDTNNDAAMNGSEVGADGVTVQLYAADGSGNPTGLALATDTTSSGGYYLFDDLNPGDYVVVLPASNFTGAGALTGYWSSETTRNLGAPFDELETLAVSPENDLDHDDNGTRDTSAGAFANAVLSQAVTLGNSSEPKGETGLESGVGQGTHPDDRANMTVDFGFYKVSVGNLVWADANQDGAFSAGEPVFSGAAVTLYAADGLTVLGVTSTDASGLYRFDNLPEGETIISVVAPTGTVSTRDDFVPTDNADANQNYDDNDNGLGLLGGETFSSLFSLTAGDGGLQSKNIVDDGTGTLVALGATHNPTLDFGFTPVYSLGNRVWFDTNNDRVIDNGETGVDGVTVQLYAASDLTTILDTQTTANGGYYLFNGLAAGDYVVSIPAENFDNTGVGDTTTALVGYWSSQTARNLVTGLVAETAADSPETGQDSDDNGMLAAGDIVAQTVTLGPTFAEPLLEGDLDLTLPGNHQGQPDSQANMTVDFGFYTITLGNLVWNDLDDSGTLNGAEAGIDGVTVEFYPVDGAGLPVGSPWTAVTAGGGLYTFSGLSQGNYLVRLPQSNFLGAGTLRDFYSSTGGGAYEPAPNPDLDTTDSDDNGSEVGALGFTGGYIQTASFALSPAAEDSFDNPTGSTGEPRVDFGVFKSLVADLSVTKDDGVTQYVPGTTVTYTIPVSNAGPSDVTGATVSDSFPAGVTASWTCVGAGGGTCTASGSGNISDTVNLPVGGTVTYTVTASIASSFTGDLVNTATVTLPSGVTDPTPGDNTATDTDTPDSQADLSITKTDGVTQYTPGTTVTYTIPVSNAGPSDVTGATVSDSFPAGVTASWTCVGAGGATCTASGSGDISDTVNLPVGGTVTYTVSASIAPSFTGDLVNTATVTAPAGVTETDTTNNTDTDTDAQDSQADLSLTKDDGVTQYTPGTTVTYTIPVSNAGPSDVTGATVSDSFPAGVTASWTCVGAGGATCTASGSGDISDTVNLPVGGTVTYTVSASIAPSFTGDLVNTATVTAPAGVTDPTPGDNTATDTDTPDSQADLGVTKDDGVTQYIPGGTLTYNITVSNAGPSDALGSQVSDALPAQITSWAWVCSGATGGASGCDGAASNSANFSDTLDLPAGSSVSYTVTAQIASAATGSLTNTVSVTPPAGVTDASSGNNTASDTDTPDSQADLSITKDDGKSYYLPGSIFDYSITVSNAGPSDVSGATVSDLKPAQITTWDWACVTTAGATCTPQTGLTGDFTDTVNLPAGSSITYTVTVTIDPAATGDLVNTVSVTPPAGITDTSSGNDTATDTDNPAGLLVTKDDGLTIVAPGTLVTYAIVIQNVGAVDMTSITVTDTLPADVSFQSAAPAPTTTPPTGTPGGVLTWTPLSLAAGASTTLQVTVKVADAPVAASITNAVNVTDAGTGATGDATDTDTIAVSNAKSLIATNQTGSADPQVLIGEILTYQISLDIPFGTMTNLNALDVVDAGLAFVRCVSINPGALTTDLAGGFAAACADPLNPTVQAEPVGDPQAINQGRRALFNFGNVTNKGATDETLTLTYEVVVLDVASNISGTTGLNNAVLWTWDGGSQTAVAPPVEVIEPELSIDKNASPNVLPYGSAVTFTIEIAHTDQSLADAYDVVVSDVLPDGLSYTAGTVSFTGLAPTTYAYDSTSHTLTFNWAVFPLGATSKITFQANFIGPSPVTNATNVVWTSLPLDPGQQSDYNTESTERWYDPADLTGLDNYGAKDSVVITAPVLPATGFAPGLVTALPAQPAEKRYQSLEGMWLEIPALNLTMPVTGVPLSSEGWDLTWLSRQAGYLQGTTYPGQVGTTGITGHVTLADGTPGPFRNLGKLFWGNQVILHAAGYRYVYEVREQRTVLPRDLSVFKQDGYTWMTLLTCDGYVPWLDSYNYRLAVRAVLLKVEVDGTPSPYNGRTQPLMDGR